ncbi:MAG: shikimate dehydrogenase [Candidatus Riflebacteria bacterium]|nr:shikimate dehydrogenase [Candidatus Riflebacteria bacterium]
MSGTKGGLKGAVIGNPISHSLSPVLHLILAERLGMRDFTYSAVEVLPRDLRTYLDELRCCPEFVGINVTVPHKEAILAELDEVIVQARAIGAVNLVHLKDGKLIGHNTDYIGFLRVLDDRKIKLHDCNVVVWGAGGAAKAVLHALGWRHVASVAVLNRDQARSKALISAFTPLFPKTRFYGVVPAVLTRVGLVVNTTPVGMRGYAMEGDINATSEFFSGLARISPEPDALAFDLIYNPERTPFLSLASHLGFRCVAGLDMLVHQAIESWKIWTNSTSESLGEILPSIMPELRRALAPPIFLCGPMGAGKSTVGSILAQRLGWDFVDTDCLVEAESGLSVSEIFEQQGEQAFRVLEKKAVLNSAARTRTVVALGGGALMTDGTLAAVERSGILVYLEAKTSALVRRLQVSENELKVRPLLSPAKSDGQISVDSRLENLVKARQAIYLRASHRVQTDNLEPNAVAAVIIRLTEEGEFS